MDNQQLPQTQQLNTDLKSVPKAFSLRSFLLANKYVLIFISVVALISFSSSVYLLASQNKTNVAVSNPKQITGVFTPSPEVSEPTKAASPTPQLSPTYAINPLAGWLTYTSTAYGFSIKYPGDWLAKSTAQQDPKILEYVVFAPKNATASGELTITLSYETRTYQEALVIDPQVGEKIAVASVSGTKKTQQDSNGNTTINVVLPVSTKTMIFYAREKYKDILNQMLSTFTLPK